MSFLCDEDFFMAMAVIAAQRSKDPKYQVGACIVNTDGLIVGIGYNGYHYKWSKFDNNISWDQEEKHYYVCHAELNAITFRNSVDVKNCTIYQTLAPCNDCAKYIVQSKIAKVYYLLDDKCTKDEFKLAKTILNKAGVLYEKYKYRATDEILPSFIRNFKPIDTKKSTARESFLQIDDFFQHAALLASKRCQGSQINGVSIRDIDTNIFLGSGYSGFPYGYELTDCEDAEDGEKCHAIVNALIDNNVRIKKFEIYSTHVPCNKCVQSILQYDAKVINYCIKFGNEIQECNLEKSKYMISKLDEPITIAESFWTCVYHENCELKPN